MRYRPAVVPSALTASLDYTEAKPGPATESPDCISLAPPTGALQALIPPDPSAVRSASYDRTDGRPDRRTTMRHAPWRITVKKYTMTQPSTISVESLTPRIWWSLGWRQKTKRIGPAVRLLTAWHRCVCTAPRRDDLVVNELLLGGRGLPDRERGTDHEHFLNIGRMRKLNVPKNSWGFAADLGLIDQDSLNDLREIFPGRPMKTVSMRGIIMSEYCAALTMPPSVPRTIGERTGAQMTDTEGGTTPSTRTLALGPDDCRPGEINLDLLDAVAWDRLEHGPGDTPIPDLFRALVTANDDDWDYLLWFSLMGDLMNQGTCYPATPAAMPVLGELAGSVWLPAKRRLDLHMALLAIGAQESADLVAYAMGDVTYKANQWTVAAHLAVGSVVPGLLARWDHQAPAVQFALAVLAALYPEQAATAVAEIGRFADEYAGTQPGAYLDLAVALLRGDDAAALHAARGIAGWHEDIDADWLDLPGLPVRVTCTHLLHRGAMSIATNHD